MKVVESILPERRSTVTTNPTLIERGTQHGNAHLQFQVAQNFKELMRATPNWELLSDQQRETLEMIATKLSRILVGDHNFIEHWRDCWGYFELQTLMMEGKQV